MFVVSSPQAENGRRRQKIAELMGRVLAHGVTLEAPEQLDFDIAKMMEEKKKYLESRGMLKEVQNAKKDDSMTLPQNEQDDDADDDHDNTT